jgi:hypothetical protein
MGKIYEPKYSPLYKLSKLLDKYKCPKCNGRGYIKCMYNGYDGELPDSRGYNYVFEEAYKDVECDVCNGIGYIKEETILNYIQDDLKVKQ